MIKKTRIYALIFIAIVLITSFGINAQTAKSQEREGQVYIQQKSVAVSVTVLDNLSLLIVDGQPKYATNWPYGATLQIDESHPPVTKECMRFPYWTVTANY